MTGSGGWPQDEPLARERACGDAVKAGAVARWLLGGCGWQQFGICSRVQDWQAKAPTRYHRLSSGLASKGNDSVFQVEFRTGGERQRFGISG